MTTPRNLCVYCGSGPGSSPRFVEAALALGRIFAENNIRLVYGGGSVGLMGAVADAAMAAGGAQSMRAGSIRYARAFHR